MIDNEIESFIINLSIREKYDKESNKAVRKMIKMGFVTIDGELHQYNPGGVFLKVTDAYCTDVYNNIVTGNGNYWNLLSPGEIIDLLHDLLPEVSQKDAEDFVKYNEQFKVIINEELIEDLTKKAIAENKELQRTDIDFTGKKDLISQITILRNNDIFTDNKRRLYCFKDGKLLRYTSHDILGLLNSTISTDDKYFTIQEVKNHFQDYSDNLTDVTQLVELLRIKEYKENILTDCKPGFENILKVISKYGGKK